ncbi:MAG: ribosome biogenesis GTP-binding protein YihA/YsxC [Tannerellaceae bacterium]|jgi:GTP-binding protein|nr:ribosome biogenesis GTP-binding protein YihA/YsxC [Tannerellaceae bacterium]
MEIKYASFVVSNTDVRKCPQDGKPEYAFIGRSNVGKSSLINMLTNHAGLALTSQTPGKTQLINHFIVNGQWYLVDLPGYGYAQKGRAGREKMHNMIEDYVIHREQLINLFVLIDCRHEPQQIDLEFITYIGEHNVPFSLVFTKTDKLSHSRLNLNLAAYKAKLLESWEELPPIFLTSSMKKSGREELLEYIATINAKL